MKKGFRNVLLRHVTLDDLIEIQRLFVDTINVVCDKDYTADQRRVWTAAVENRERWINKLKNQYFLVAEWREQLVGFGSLENGNYIDFLYVHKDYQKHGIATQLFKALEAESLKQGALILFSDVSKTARPFFERNGFQVVKEQLKVMESVEITNFRMKKSW